MNRPWVNYPFSLATQIGVVADPDWLESGAKDHPIGTGPFVFESWRPDNDLVVTKNPDYWQTDAQGTRLPYLDRVTFRPLPDNDSRSATLEAGGIDAMQTSDSNQILKFSKLADKGDYQLFNDVSGETAEAFVQLNTMAPPFDDPDARRALALATDTKAYVDVQTGGLNEPARGPFPPSSPWYVPTTYPEYDKDAAKQLVEQVKAESRRRIHLPDPRRHRRDESQRASTPPGAVEGGGHRCADRNVRTSQADHRRRTGQLPGHGVATVRFTPPARAIPSGGTRTRSSRSARSG